MGDCTIVTHSSSHIELGVLHTTAHCRGLPQQDLFFCRSQQVLWGLSVLIFVLASSREPVLGVAGITFPLYESIVRAGGPSAG